MTTPTPTPGPTSPSYAAEDPAGTTVTTPTTTAPTTVPTTATPTTTTTTTTTTPTTTTTTTTTTPSTTTTTTTTTDTTTTTTTEPSSTTESTTSTEPPPEPNRPAEPAAAALYDALVTEHAVIYAYGIVSAHSTPEDNDLVAKAIATHRDQREALIKILSQRSITAPLPAVGYQLPMPVDNPTEAANLAVRLEDDAATAWRAVLEQADNSDDRALAVNALTASAVTAAQWRQVLNIWPATEAFPGGNE